MLEGFTAQHLPAVLSRAPSAARPPAAANPCRRAPLPGADSRIRVWSSGFLVQDSGFRVYGLGFRV